MLRPNSCTMYNDAKAEQAKKQKGYKQVLEQK